MAVKFIEVKLVRSLIGRLKNQKCSARVLGLRKINQVVKVLDNPENRGLIAKINFLVQYRDL